MARQIVCPGCDRERVYHAKGLCRSCYMREWNRQKVASNPDYQNKRVRKSARKKGPFWRFNRWLIYKYGITYSDYLELLRKQNWRCATCPSIEPGHGRLFFCVDHDHNTGVIRGLLCQDCNLALGKVKDDIGTLRNLIAYLERASINVG